MNNTQTKSTENSGTIKASDSTFSNSGPFNWPPNITYSDPPLAYTIEVKQEANHFEE